MAQGRTKFCTMEDINKKIINPSPGSDALRPPRVLGDQWNANTSTDVQEKASRCNVAHHSTRNSFNIRAASAPFTLAISS